MASPLLAGLIVLMIGDSHYATPGTLVTTLQDVLLRQGAVVTTYAACGATAAVWAEAGIASCGTAERMQSGPVKVDHNATATVPSITNLVGTLHPGLIVVGLGDTMARYESATLPPDEIGGQVALLTSRIRALNIPCVWVGPGWGTEGGPYFKTDARTKVVSDFLAGHVAPCRYIDSTTFSRPNEWTTYDGLHYTAVGYQKWALAIDAAIVKLMSRPDG